MDFSSAVESSLAYLRSDAAKASLAKDPYWPKWNSPWWHVLALREAGHAHAVPREVLSALLEASARHYVPYFPRSAAELPPGLTMRSNVLCHCALGSLLSAGHDALDDSALDAAISWASPFIAKYQLADGGWNCDERAYGKENPRSSVVSTVPVLEYLVAKTTLDAASRERLGHGIAFLLELKFFRSRRTGAVLDEGWLTPASPRFYEYDVLRGLRLTARWSRRTGQQPAKEAIDEARALMTAWFAQPLPQPRNWALSASARSDHGVESSFPLCDALNDAQIALPLLRMQWAEVCDTFGWRPRD